MFLQTRQGSEFLAITRLHLTKKRLTVWCGDKARQFDAVDYDLEGLLACMGGLDNKTLALYKKADVSSDLKGLAEKVNG